MNGVPVKGPDRFYYPVRPRQVDDQAPSLEVTTGGTTYTVELTGYGGVPLFAHLESSSGDLVNAGLFHLVEYELSDDTPLTFTVSPISVGGRPNAGLRIEADGDFTLDVSSPGFDPALLGYTGSSASISSSGSPPSVESAWPVYGVWDPVTPYSVDRPTYRRPKPSKHLATSSDFTAYAHQVDIGDTQLRRALKYPDVHEVAITTGLSSDPQYADPAGLDTDDPHSQLYHLWKVASQRRKILATYNTGRDDMQITPHAWERGYLAPDQKRQEFVELHEASEEFPETRHVSFELEVTRAVE